MSSLPSWMVSLDSSIYTTKNYVVLDLETTNIDKGDACTEENQVLLAAWKVVKGSNITNKICWGSEYDQAELVNDILNANFFVAHNAMFETKWLKRAGIPLEKCLCFCTQTAEYVIAGNRKLGTSLAACCKRRGLPGKLDLVSFFLKNGKCVSNLPKSWVTDYCVRDVDLCARLFESQIKMLERRDLLAVTLCRNIKIPVLADLEFTGVALDKEAVEKEYHKLKAELVKLEAELISMAGDLNIKSAPQMREYLYKTLEFSPPKQHNGNLITTPKGELSTSNIAISALKPKTKEQKDFLILRNKVTKTRDLLSKYVNKMFDCCNENNGILKCAYNPCVTQTHRLSCSGKKYRIQLQNVPREYKKMFCSRNSGWVLSEYDYSQLEYRTAVDIAKDVAGLKDIKGGVDAHAFTASIIFGKKWEETKCPKIRTKAKAHTFKPLYGGFSGSPKEKKYYTAFREKHAQITGWQEDNKSTVLRSKKLRIPSRLIFYWPDTTMQASGYITNSQTICNYPVQSFAGADIVPIGLTYAWHRLKAADMNSFLVNTVHDSVVGEVLLEEKEMYDKIMRKSMVDDVVKALKLLYNYDWTTPLEVEGEYYDA